jgi:enamine deaminase RidA (YjgF/YER057c/UK114 family)
MSQRAPQRVLQPQGWPRPSGYSNGIAANGTLVFVAGQIGWDASRHIERGDFVAQARQALQNVMTVLAEAGAGAEHVVRLTWYVTDAAQYRASAGPLGAVYREIMGKHYPTMSAVQVAALMEPDALVEIEATAVV